MARPTINRATIGAFPRLLLVLASALALLATLLVAAPVQAQDPASDESFLVVKDDELPSNAELAARVTDITFESAQRVVIARDDEFADALASGLLQSNSPLLMVPRTGPIPDSVLERLRGLGAFTAVILGGEAAVGDDVAAQLGAEGLSVERRAGGTRFDTAIEIAQREAPNATTAILARAFASDPNNPTQGFADALGAGAMAAENEWPILLTDTNTLTPQTRDYLAASQINRVMIVGGTAAVSVAVENEMSAMGITVQRIAGDTRFGTAVEVAKETFGDTIADVDRVVLVDGTSPNGFAGGFASAGHAAANDAPILLANGIMLPPETEAFIEGGAAFAQAGDPIAITCVVHPLACDSGREMLGLIDLPLLDVNPPINSLVQPGQQVQLTLTPTEEGANMPVTVKGSCLDGQQDLTTGSDGTATFVLSQAFPPFAFCDVDITYGDPDARISQGYSYAVNAEGRGSGVTISSEIFSYGTVATTTPLFVSDRIECTGAAGTSFSEDSTYEAKYVYPDFFVQTFALSSFPLEAHPGDSCTATAQTPPGVSNLLWGVYSWADSGLRNPLVLGSGNVATFDFDDIGGVSDVNVVWIFETNTPDVGTPPSPPNGIPGQVFNPEALSITCDGVPIEPGLSFQTPGASCTAVAPPGRLVVVVEPDRPIVPVPSADFAAPTSNFTVAVHTVLADSGAVAGGQGGSDGCIGAAELPFATITQGQVTPGQPAAYYQFPAFEGELLRFRADAIFGDLGSSLDPILTLYNPDGSVLASNDDGDTGLNSRVDATIPSEATYCLEVSGFAGSTGDFLLAADPAPGVIDAGTFSAAEPTRSYFYTLTEGDLLIAELRAPGFEATDPLMAIYGPDGTEVAFDDDGGGYPNARIELVVPQSGDYEIVIGTFAESYGPFLFEIAGFFAPIGFAQADTFRGGQAPRTAG